MEAWSSQEAPWGEPNFEATVWQEAHDALLKENALLKSKVERLTQELLEARKTYELDYQLYLLREKTKDEEHRKTPFGLGRSGVGFDKVFEKVTSTYNRQRGWSKTSGFTGSPKSQVAPGMILVGDDEGEDPELAAQLLKLLEDGIK
jgi:hypothetical protein